MKRPGHLFWTFLYIFILIYLLEPLALVLIFIIVFIGLFPDLDYGDNHRFWITHSILLPLIAWIFYPNILTLLILLAIGHHLALDTVGNIILRRKAVGYYTIVLIPSINFNFYFFRVKTRSYRLSGRISTVWLLGNWIISIVILIYYYITIGGL